MRTNTLGLMMLTIVTMGSIGCAGSAHVVRRGSYSGELALTGGVHARMEAAQSAMLDHCEGRVRMLDTEQARTMAAVDPGIAKADASPTPIEGERLYYVCVTRAAGAR